MQAWLRGGFHGTRKWISILHQCGFVGVAKDDLVPPEALATMQLDAGWSSYNDLAEDTSLLVDLDMDVELSILDAIDGKKRTTSTKATKLMFRLR